MEAILLIEPIHEAAVQLLEKQFRVVRISQLDEVRAALQQADFRFVFCPLRQYHPRLGIVLQGSREPARLVLVRTPLDKLVLRSEDSIGYWQMPYTHKSLQNLLSMESHQSLGDLQRIHVMENRRFQIIRIHEIVLIKRHAPGQLLFHTTEGDHIINGNLISILPLVPEHCLERISDQLIVPFGMRNRISTKGYPFRGGYIPIHDSYLKTRPQGNPGNKV